MYWYQYNTEEKNEDIRKSFYTLTIFPSLVAGVNQELG